MTNCPVCGGGVAADHAGRPPTYCSSACRRAGEYALRRLQARLMRLEDEAESCRRDRSGLVYVDFSTAEQRAADVAREIERAEKRLRELLAVD